MQSTLPRRMDTTCKIYYGNATCQFAEYALYKKINNNEIKRCE